MSLVVIVHELAHLVSARLLGVAVHEFGIGFPPRALSLGTHRDIHFTLNWLPLGGFVRLAGENDPSLPGAFAGAALWRRLVILVAGSLANIALAIALFWLAIMIVGQHSPLEALQGALGFAGQVISLTIDAIISLPGQLLTKPAEAPVGGLPSIVEQSGQAVEKGLPWLIGFVGMISLSVGVVNLLPLPPLDGGHAATLLIRPLLRSRTPARLARAAMWASVIGVLGVFLAINVIDLLRHVSP